MKLDKSSLLALVIFFFAAATLVIMYVRSLPAPVPMEVATAPTVSKQIQAKFMCSGGRSIDAVFKDASVTLKLSDSRELTLPQAISADGGRYANADESFVFWNKGDGAFIQEAGTTTYSDCITMKNPL